VFTKLYFETISWNIYFWAARKFKVELPSSSAKNTAFKFYLWICSKMCTKRLDFMVISKTTSFAENMSNWGVRGSGYSVENKNQPFFRLCRTPNHVRIKFNSSIKIRSSIILLISSNPILTNIISRNFTFKMTKLRSVSIDRLQIAIFARHFLKF
jgi:hypothetical protein